MKPYTDMPNHCRRFAVLLAIGTMVWAVLTRGAPSSWILGITSAALFALLLIADHPLRLPRLRLLGLLRFFGYFIRHSLRSGTDVARQALSPRLSLSPSMTDYQTRLPAGAARVIFANAISLLPGTLTCDLDEDRLRIHILTGTHVHDDLAELETMIAAALAPEPKRS
ncbi:MAG: Na+/H+ antiporter subunit E [Verrucomicrobia bacterium]|nr:Na+/H+ antiporter subunit E [Verrucomicrobiota bacterium]